MIDNNTRKYPRTMAEAFPDVRASAGSHYPAERSNSWIVGAVILACFVFAGYPVVKQGITVIETEIALEEERAAVEAQSAKLYALCGSHAYDEIEPGVYQCFTHRGMKTKIVRIK